MRTEAPLLTIKYAAIPHRISPGLGTRLYEIATSLLHDTLTFEGTRDRATPLREIPITMNIRDQFRSSGETPEIAISTHDQQALLLRVRPKGMGNGSAYRIGIQLQRRAGMDHAQLSSILRSTLEERNAQRKKDRREPTEARPSSLPPAPSPAPEPTPPAPPSLASVSVMTEGTLSPSSPPPSTTPVFLPLRATVRPISHSKRLSLKNRMERLFLALGRAHTFASTSITEDIAITTGFRNRKALIVALGQPSVRCYFDQSSKQQGVYAFSEIFLQTVDPSTDPPANPVPLTQERREAIDAFVREASKDDRAFLSLMNETPRDGHEAVRRISNTLALPMNADELEDVVDRLAHMGVVYPCGVCQHGIQGKTWCINEELLAYALASLEKNPPSTPSSAPSKITLSAPVAHSLNEDPVRQREIEEAKQAHGIAHETLECLRRDQDRAERELHELTEKLSLLSKEIRKAEDRASETKNRLDALEESARREHVKQQARETVRDFAIKNGISEEQALRLFATMNPSE